MRDSHITSTEVDGQLVIHVEGLISEDFDASALAVEEASAAQPIRIDVGGVSRFSSTGVREWIYFVRRIPPGGFLLERCSVGFIKQLSTVSNLAPSQAVVSFTLPWWCGACERAEDVVVGRAEARAQVDAGRPCARCGQSMILDELPEVYLAWMVP